MPWKLKPNPTTRPTANQSAFQRKGGGKGGKGKQQSKGKSKDSGQGPKWCIEFMEAGKKCYICKRFNLRSGCKLDNCSFVHGCAVDVGGKPCGKDHPVYMRK